MGKLCQCRRWAIWGEASFPISFACLNIWLSLWGGGEIFSALCECACVYYVQVPVALWSEAVVCQYSHRCWLGTGMASGSPTLGHRAQSSHPLHTFVLSRTGGNPHLAPVGDVIRRFVWVVQYGWRRYMRHPVPVRANQSNVVLTPPQCRQETAILGGQVRGGISCVGMCVCNTLPVGKDHQHDGPTWPIIYSTLVVVVTVA